MVAAEQVGREEETVDMKIDITLDDSSAGTLSSVYYGIRFTDWVLEVCKQRPNFAGLVILLKTLLNLHQLNVSYYGLA